MRTIRRYQNGGKNGGESEDTTRRVLDRYLDKRSMDELLYDLKFFDSEGGIKDSTDSRKYLMDLIEFSSRQTGTPKLDIIQRFNDYMKSGNTSRQDAYKALGLDSSELHHFPPHIYNESSQQFSTVGGDWWDNLQIERGEMERPNYPLIPEEQYMPSIMPKQIPTGVKKPELQIPESSPHYLPKGAWRKPHYKYNRDGKGTQDGWIVYQRGKSPKIKYFNN